MSVDCDEITHSSTTLSTRLSSQVILAAQLTVKSYGVKSSLGIVTWRLQLLETVTLISIKKYTSRLKRLFSTCLHSFLVVDYGVVMGDFR